MIVFASLWVAWEWAYLLRISLSPVVVSLAMLTMAGYGALQIRRLRQQARRLQQGMQGETLVGHFLDRLRGQGYEVIHDIAEDGWNIDHVLVGPTGLYAIETKTISKPTDHDARILYDGKRVLVDGQTPDRDPLKQAESVADRVKEIIQTCTGDTVSVRPVVVYPGWYVEKRCRSPKVWVVNENLLPAYLNHEREYLTQSQVLTYANVLANHVRSTCKP